MNAIRLAVVVVPPSLPFDSSARGKVDDLPRAVAVAATLSRERMVAVKVRRL